MDEFQLLVVNGPRKNKLNIDTELDVKQTQNPTIPLTGTDCAASGRTKSIKVDVSKEHVNLLDGKFGTLCRSTVPQQREVCSWQGFL